MCVVCVPVRGVCGGGGLHTRVAPLSLTASFTLPTPLSYISPSRVATGSGRRSASTSDLSLEAAICILCMVIPILGNPLQVPGNVHGYGGALWKLRRVKLISAQRVAGSTASRLLTDGPLSTTRVVIAGGCWPLTIVTFTARTRVAEQSATR